MKSVLFILCIVWGGMMGAIAFGQDGPNTFLVYSSQQPTTVERPLSESTLESFKAIADEAREAWELLNPINGQKPNAAASIANLEEAKKIYDSEKNLPFSRDVITALLYKARGFPDAMCKDATDNPLEFSTPAMAFEALNTAWRNKKHDRFRLQDCFVEAKLIPVTGEVASYAQDDIDYLTAKYRLSSSHHHLDIPLFPGVRYHPAYRYPESFSKEMKFTEAEKRDLIWVRAGFYGMSKAAELLDQAQLYDYAWRTYLEALYGWGDPTPFYGNNPRFGSIYSVKNAKYWHKTAKAAYLAGKKELAWDLLLKTAVFGDEECYKSVQETAANWLSGKADTKPEPLTEAKRRKLLMDVIIFHKNLNLHPRAWKLVEQQRKHFDNPDKLIRELKKAWEKVVKERGIRSLTVDETYIYGQKVYKRSPDDRLHAKALIRAKKPIDIVVPWAMENKALKEATNKVRALYKCQGGGEGEN